VLTGSVSLQSLEPVSGREAQIAQVDSGFELIELTTGDLADRRPAFAKPCFKELPGLVVLEAPDHYRQSITERILRQAAPAVRPAARFSLAWDSWFPTLRQKKGEGWATRHPQCGLD
jgi:hypothetical protein